MTFTGAPTACETRTASETKSGSSRRPNPPPRNVVWTRTRCLDKPVSSAATSCARVWFCVGAQTSQPSARTCAVQFIGSIVAWCRNGTSYTASTRLAAPASAPAASPSLRASTPGCSASRANSARLPHPHPTLCRARAGLARRASRCRRPRRRRRRTLPPRRRPSRSTRWARAPPRRARRGAPPPWRRRTASASPEHRAPLDRRDQHPRHRDVDAEYGAAVHFGRRIEPRCPRAEQAKVLRDLERHLGGLGVGKLSGARRELAVRQPALGGGVNHGDLLGVARRALHPPRRGRRADQHLARDGARLAQRLP